MTEDRYNAKRYSRNTIDIIDIQKNLRRTHKGYKKSKFSKYKGAIFAFLGIIIFFLLGYAIAALGLPIWARVTIFVLVAFLGIIPGYLLASLFH